MGIKIQKKIISSLSSLLHKIKIVKEPEDPAKAASLKLRQYFLMLHKRNKGKSKKVSVPVKYTMFLEPCPYLSVYVDGDENLPIKQKLFYSFRLAYFQYMRALKNHRTIEAKKNRAVLLT